MSHHWNRIIVKGMGAVLAGTMLIAAPSMEALASGALGSSATIGIAGQLAQAESAEAVENAVSEAVLTSFGLDGYSNLGIVVVSEGKVNIRDSASTDGKIVGKIGNEAGCDVIAESEDGEWLQIKSGEVEGYIKAEYVLTGSEALDKASSLLKTVAEVTTDGLRVRTEPDMDSEILDIVGSGQSFDVVEELDEWVKIDLDGEDGYIYKEYVEVGAKLDEALTISEVLYGEGVSNVRVAIADFAKQYIGNPYVWGGTSLTKGADCSGFVLAVFRNYGISLPHSSKAQANCGTKISLSELKPGDLVFYGSRSSINHVAIYVGGGQVVHASNKRVGITISSLYYRTPVKAVRIIND
ncbi:MAG: NlpC/P60 family protein [Lachnospiraceae bacterium]|nr:NlpC/P60 family protein [Lachnospiraceae bacterium]